MRCVAAFTVLASVSFCLSVLGAALPAFAQPAAKQGAPAAPNPASIETAKDLYEAVTSLTDARRLERASPMDRARAMQQANALIERARIKISPDELLPVLGLCYERVGDGQRASKYHAKYLRQNPQSLEAMGRMANLFLKVGEIQKGVSLAKQILDSGAEPSPQNNERRLWARRQIAIARASTRQYAQLKLGIEMIDKNADANGALSDEDLLVKADLLGQMPDAKNRGDAMAILKAQIDAAQKATPPKQLHDNFRRRLANLYIRFGQWPKARDIMIELVQSATNMRLKLQYAAELVDKMNRNGEADHTGPYLALLESQQNDPIVAATLLQLRAVTLSKQGKQTEAVRLITQAARNVWPPDTEEKLATIRDVSLLFLEIGRYAEAEKMLRAYVKLVPADRLLLAQHLVLRGDINEGLDVYQQEIDLRPNDRVRWLPVVIQALGSRRDETTKQQIDRVVKWADPLLRANVSDLAAILMQAQLKAGLADLRGDHQAVARTWSDLLKQPGFKETKSPTVGVVMDRLAFTMAHHLSRGDKKICAAALLLSNQAIEMLGPQSELLDVRAMIHFAAGDVKQARTEMTKALGNHDPGRDAVRRFHMAMIENAWGNRAAAATELRTAIDHGLKIGQLPPGDAHTFEDLSRRLLGAGK